MSPRYPVNASVFTNQTPFHTYIIIPGGTLYTNQRHLPIYWQWYCPLQFQPTILPDQDLSLVPVNTIFSYIISKYLKYKPNVFCTWVYVAIILKASSPPCSLSIFSRDCFPQSLNYPVRYLIFTLSTLFSMFS